MVSAIIVAAGSSSRMGGIKKQFWELEGIPVVVRTVRKFEAVPEVGEIIVVTGASDLKYMRRILEEYGCKKPLRIAEGGESRQQSVSRGFSICDKSSELVAIHDAARPFVTKHDILNVIKDAKIYRASTLGAPVKDTIKIVENGRITGTPNRDSLYLTQTPQVFETSLYADALAQAEQAGLSFTDDCQLVERYGVPIHMTIGSYSNIKLTTPEDFILAQALLRQEETK